MTKKLPPTAILAATWQAQKSPQGGFIYFLILLSNEDISTPDSTTGSKHPSVFGETNRVLQMISMDILSSELKAQLSSPTQSFLTSPAFTIH